MLKVGGQIFNVTNSSILVTKKFDSNLFEFLKSYPSDGPSLEITERFGILTKVAETVQALHQNRVIHMDLKSQNIYVDFEQEKINDLVIADFGIGDNAGPVRVGPIRVDHHCGTPGVGAPEQFISTAGRASDIFALGKLFVQIIFPLDTSWGIIRTPVNQSQIDSIFENSSIFKQFHDLVSSMLEVKRCTDSDSRKIFNFISGGSEEKAENRLRCAGIQGNVDFDPKNPQRGNEMEGTCEFPPDGLECEDDQSDFDSAELSLRNHASDGNGKGRDGDRRNGTSRTGSERPLRDIWNQHRIETRDGGIDRK